MLDPIKSVRRKKMNLLFAIILLISCLVMFLGDSQIDEQKNRDPLNALTQMTKEVGMEASLTALTLNATSYTLRTKESRRTFVIANYSDGSNDNVTEQSHYSTTNSKVVTVNALGLITAVGPGYARVTIKYKGLTKLISVSVSTVFREANVKDFGACGDGVCDDTTAFQNAIDYLSIEGGGDVFVPAGTYILNPIFLKPNVNLVGENRDNVILKLSNAAPDDYTRLISMDDNTQVQSITCDGNYQNHPNGIEHMHCIFAYNKNNLLIDNNKMMNAYGDGISISGSEEASNYVIISNNIVLENQRSQIVIEQVNYLQIFNNMITSETGRPGIHFEPWEKNQFYDAKITGNTIITNSKGYCLLLAGSDSELVGEGVSEYFYHGIEFSQNIVKGPSCSLLIMNTSGAKIHDNMLDVLEVFVWRKNEDVSIYNNKIKGINGVQIEGGLEERLISKGVNIYDNSITTSEDGVIILAGSQDTTIKGNDFTGSGKGRGVSLFASANILNTTISGNIFKNYQGGVYSESVGEKLVNSLTVSRNRFTNNIGYSLFVNGDSHNVKLDNNLVSDTSGKP
ncbi:right-handed parallel beta-helix repeat-containing protein [Peribacillus loiseleuriae]|uniref:right-handed parallel beta-helix repeat-containing protein n=1 Tax=Peribacillus loiseleuriae TaxID=1679170 RepID=UPI003CFF07B3